MHPNYFLQVRLRAGAPSHQMHRMHSEQGVFGIDLLLFFLNCICLVVVFVLLLYLSCSSLTSQSHL